MTSAERNSRQVYGDTIIQETQAFLRLLEEAPSLVLGTMLVAVPDDVIDRYASETGRDVPADYRYWLTHHGAGVIDTVFGNIRIPSPDDLFEYEKHGRLWTISPKNCWHRICLVYSGSPCVIGIETPLTNSDGCCPVIKSYEYDDRVQEVLASSWPMFLAWKLISMCRKSYDIIADQASLSPAILDATRRIMSLEMPRIDAGLSDAYERATRYNQTTSDQKEYDQAMTRIQQDFARTTLSSIDRSRSGQVVDNIECALASIQASLERGDESCANALDYLREQASVSDLPIILQLVDHNVDDVRRCALLSLKRLIPNPAECEELKQRIVAPIRHVLTRQELIEWVNS